MFKGKQLAVVSGGASGLGFAVAKSIVARDGRVTILDRNATEGERAAQMLGSQAHFIQCDIRDSVQVDAALEGAKQFSQGLNLAVSCAGVLGAGKVLGKKGPMEPEHFKQVIDVNLVGAFLFTRAAAIQMAENDPNERAERGVIVHTASIAAYEGQVGQASYAASKAGIVGMILPMAREFANRGIRVVAIAPGVFATPMLEGVSDEVRAALEAEVPFPSRLGEPEEFASMVHAIYENQMINGSVVRLDGASRLR